MHKYKNRPWYRYYVLALLLAILTLSFVDRQLIAVASPDLKEELGVSDTQLGLLKGFSFALFYGTAALAIAKLTDRSSRIKIISISVLWWSGMTALTGWAGSFTQLVFARIGLGLGEAGSGPASHSLLYGYFAKDNMHTALSIYSLGIPLGNMLAFLIGSMLIAETGWRVSFLFFGGLGVLLAVIFKLTVAEPLHEINEPTDTTQIDQNPLSFFETFTVLWRITSYKYLCIGSSLIVFGAFGLVTWVTDFFVRNHQLVLEDIGFRLAIVYGVTGSAGMLLGGVLSEVYGRRSKIFYLAIPGGAQIFSASCLAVAIWIPDSDLSFLLLGATVFFIFFFQGPTSALAQILAPSGMKAQSAASIIFIQVIFGVGLAPLVVGGVSDILLAHMDSGTALRFAMTILCISLIFGGLVFLFCSNKLIEDVPKSANTR